MKIVVDRSRCQKHGQCVFVAPDVFDLDESDELVYDPQPGEEHRDVVANAVAACPEQAITVGE